MKRKDTAIQQQVANLQMKIVQEDKAVENRTTDLLNDWEKTKPVAVREIESSKYIWNTVTVHTAQSPLVDTFCGLKSRAVEAFAIVTEKLIRPL